MAQGRGRASGMGCGCVWRSGRLALGRYAAPQRAGDRDRGHDQRQGTQNAAQGMQGAARHARPGW